MSNTVSQISFLPKLKQKKERKFPIFRLVILILVFPVIYLAYSFLRVHLKPTPGRGGTIIEAMVGRPHLLNPLYGDSDPIDQQIVKMIFRGLLSYDENNNVVLDLAAKWSVSTDGKVYDVDLKNDQKWQDGQAITADDVVFTYKLTQDPAYDGQEKSTFRDVKIEKISSSHVRFTLKEPFSPFTESLSLGILPYHILKDKSVASIKKDNFNLKPIGDGRFRVVGIEQDLGGGLIKSLTLKSSSSYLDAIKFQFYPTAQAATLALKLGEVDSFATTELGSFDELNSFSNFQTYQWILNSNQYALFFNLSKDPLRNLDFRKALTEGTIRPTKFGEESFGPIPQKSWAFDKEFAQGTFNQAEAAKKIAALNLDLKSPIVITVPNKSPLPSIAEQIVAGWKEIGITGKVQIVDLADLLDHKIPNRDFQVLLFGQIFGNDPDTYVFWHSSQAKPPGLNLTGLANRRVDRSLEDGRKKSSISDRKTAYRDFQMAISQEVPAVFLYQPRFYYFVSKKIKGINLDSIWFTENRFLGFDKWYIKETLSFR